MVKQKPAIRQMTKHDWPSVRRIYEQGIASGNATFETAAPAWEDWDAGHLRDCRLVAVDSGHVVGWAALSPVSSRSAYSGVAEVSVYIASDMRGRGIGSYLIQAVVSESERNGVWTLQASMFPENEASIAAHMLCGFRVVGRRRKIGQTNGVWRDVLLFEKRSSNVGISRAGHI